MGIGQLSSWDNMGISILRDDYSLVSSCKVAGKAFINQSENTINGVMP